MPAAERDALLARLADLIGLPVDLVARAEGRIAIRVFARELLRDERKVLGLYDATITATDPFPDRDAFAGPDPTLSASPPCTRWRQPPASLRDRRRDGPRVHAAQLRGQHRRGRTTTEQHCVRSAAGATDDFRYGMALNPHMKAFVTHGRYDLVTPYYASDRLRNLMRLDPQMAGPPHRPPLRRRHMFYAWKTSRKAFTAAIDSFVASALS